MKRIKKGLAFFLATWIWMLALPVGTLSAMENTAEFLGGDGTEESPYLISNKTHLNNVRNHLDAHFLMVADIEFNEADFAQGGEFYNGGLGWKPIGTERTTAFTGVFDGGGHTIRKLTILGTSRGFFDIGLFGVNKGIIQNVGLAQTAITRNFFNSSTVNAGGIAGTNYKTISRCYATGTMSITANYANIAVVGGLAGYNGGRLEDCYSVTNIQSPDWAGGVAGSNGGTIRTCYYMGDLAGRTTGGIAGANSNPAENCYYLSNVSRGAGNNTNPGTVKAYTLEQMQEQGNFTGFDFGSIWEMSPKKGYPFPFLKGIQHIEQPENQTEFLGGNGRIHNPYQIASPLHLNNVRRYADCRFVMVSDVLFTKDAFEEGGTFYNNGQGWEPIGEESVPFTGHFNGNGHTIQHMQSKGDKTGCFGYNSGIVENLGIIDARLNATSTAGGIACWNNGIIRNAFLTGDVASSGVAGGIAGYNTGDIESCYNTAEICARSRAGGIGGQNQAGGRIVQCYNTGTIASSTIAPSAPTELRVGGIVGFDNSKNTANYCYNIGEVKLNVSYGNAYVGGISGGGSYSTAGNQIYCLNHVERAVGDTDQHPTFTEDQLKDPTTFSGFDFASIWEIDNYGHYPFPQLKYNRQEPIKRIELLTGPTDGRVLEGMLPDLTGAVVRITYVNGSVIDTEATAQMLSELDVNKIGRQTIHLSYGGRATAESIDIEVVPKSIISIAVTTLPNKTDYVQGQPLNPTGGQLTIYYNNSTSKTVDLRQAQLSCNPDQTGSVTVAVNYQGFTDNFVILVAKRQIQSIHIIEPTKLVYIEGQELDLTGGKLRITYVSEDDYTEEIPLVLSMLSGYDANTLGIQSLTVTYEGKTCSLMVNVVAKSLTEIRVTKQPAKRTYLEEDAFDPAGMEITAYYDNGTSEVVTDYGIGGYDSAPGAKIITVTYSGKTATFEVTVRAKSLTEIRVTKQPAKRTYLEGDAFDSAGMEITAYYDNSTSEAVTDYAISGYDSAPGAKIITVTYGGKTATFEVTVRAKTLTEIRVTKQPAKRTYLEGDAFDSAGMEITAYYDNGTSEVVTDYGISGYDSTPGVKRLTVTYGGKTAALEVTVRGKALVSIAVTKNPDQMTYVEGTALDTTGMELTLVFDNGTKEVLATGWTETYDFSQPGRQEVRIDCRGKTTTLTVMVLSKTLTGIAVSRLPNKLTYIEGNAFSAAGMEVTAYYDNNTSEIVTDRVTIQGYDSAPGIKTMAISYQGKETSFTVTVEAKKPVSIAWKAKPNKTVYFVGEELSLSGAVILIRYNNGTTAEQKLEGSWGADQYNPNQIGTQTISIRYQETPPISFTVTVKSRVPSSITSGTYSVGGGFLSKVGAGTTAAQLLGGINEKDYCKVYKGNTEVTGNALVGTGMAVKLLDGGTVKQTAAVVVTGDTNGDGQITITDMLAVKAHVLKKSALAGAAAKAADTSGDKAISITDFIQIKAHILGKDKIQPRAC